MQGGTRVEQEMNIESGGRLIRKGMMTVLAERGRKVKNLRADCKLCKAEKKRGYTGAVDLTRRNCCARRMLKTEPDFAAQKSQIEEAIERRGHYCLFYPKYHCELNYIEMVWGWAKREARKKIKPVMNAK
jgi:hypothetical protein